MGSGKERNNSVKKMNKGNPRGPKTTKLKPHATNNNKTQIEAQNIEKLQPSAQLNLFLDKFQSANHLKLSCLELDSLIDKCIVDMSTDQDVESLGKHVKGSFWAIMEGGTM